MPEAYRPKGLSSAVSYQDAKAAFRWLEKAFGFEPLFVLLDAESPNVALWIPGTIGTVTVELHLRFHKDFCPGSACVLAVSVQIFALSQLDMKLTGSFSPRSILGSCGRHSTHCQP